MIPLVRCGSRLGHPNTPFDFHTPLRLSCDASLLLLPRAVSCNEDKLFFHETEIRSRTCGKSCRGPENLAEL